jgi:hypothetical protein
MEAGSEEFPIPNSYYADQESDVRHASKWTILKTAGAGGARRRRLLSRSFTHSYGLGFSGSVFGFSGVVGFAGVLGPPQPTLTVTSIAPRTNAAMILFTV